MVTAVSLVVALLTITVLFHYEALRLISRGVESIRFNPRVQMLGVIFGVIVVHLIEIAIYAATYWYGDVVVNIGAFGGVRAVVFVDYLYFSAETYTSLGLGDIYPTGDLRLIASIEALNGLLLIGWSASFTYLAMQSYWVFHAGQRAAKAERPAAVR